MSSGHNYDYAEKSNGHSHGSVPVNSSVDTKLTESYWVLGISYHLVVFKFRLILTFCLNFQDFDR